MKKTWLQHDFNARKKSSLSNLIEIGGYEGYGYFWAFAELVGEMQLHRSNMSMTLIINDSTLARELRVNRQKLERILEQFSTILGINFEESCNNVRGKLYKSYKFDVSNILIFMAKRILKTDNKSKSKNKKKKESKSKTLKIKYLDVVFLKDEEYQKLKNKFSQRFLDKCIEELDRYITNSKKGKAYTDHYKVILGWVSEKIYEKHGNMPDPIPPPPEIPIEEMADSEEVRKLVEGVKKNILKPI